jgi:hypothetical protein
VLWFLVLHSGSNDFIFLYSFARVLFNDCDHEYLLATSAGTRFAHPAMEADHGVQGVMGADFHR